MAHELRVIRTTLKKLDIKINAFETRPDSKMDTLEAKLDSKIFLGAEGGEEGSDVLGWGRSDIADAFDRWPAS